MLRNYFHVAIRHLRKNQGSTIINIVGLSTGMAIALIIGLWIVDELSYNHYFPDHQRIAQAMITQTTKQDSYTGSTVTMPMGKEFRDKYHDLFSSVALTHYNGNHLFGAGDRHLSGLAFSASHRAATAIAAANRRYAGHATWRVANRCRSTRKPLPP